MLIFTVSLTDSKDNRCSHLIAKLPKAGMGTLKLSFWDYFKKIWPQEEFETFMSRIPGSCET